MALAALGALAEYGEYRSRCRCVSCTMGRLRPASTWRACWKKASASAPLPHESWPECELISTGFSFAASEASAAKDDLWSANLLDEQ